MFGAFLCLHSEMSMLSPSRVINDPWISLKTCLLFFISTADQSHYHLSLWAMGSTAQHSSRAQLRSPHCPPGQLPAPSILTSPSADLKFIYFSVSLWQEGEAFLTHSNKGGVHQGGQSSQAEEAQWCDASPRNQRICRNTTNYHLSHMQAELNFFLCPLPPCDQRWQRIAFIRRGVWRASHWLAASAAVSSSVFHPFRGRRDKRERKPFPYNSLTKS